ncbi:acetaldehyde dehydrogenase (acetylating) [Aminipila sp.]|uniref:acetaldehyde dehydrogenase (acetylating) n=1 Tax=Aminipila sp. TaxID=2060095 RepID=UPI00289F3555|nr:acetaldehyde dehydrogenase (acetylating) [Aminipila sp.]
MLLYDKDLLSVQEVRELVEHAKTAQKELAEKTQAQVDQIVKSIADAGVRNAKRLGQLAHDETGFGIASDKVIKNIFGSKGVYERIKDMKTVGVIKRDEAAGTYAVAVPVGVIAGLIPSTNPTSTVFYKAEIAIKAGNAIVFSPHPNALKCILETVKVIRQAIVEAGGHEDLVSCISLPTIQSTDVLMSHPDTSLILATGGSAMVRAAYSSGTPAIGVGPGNGPAYIERSADIHKAVKCIMDSKTFDNGTICASEQSVICDDDMKEAVQNEMKKQGAYFLNEQEREQLGNFILRSNGTMNPMIVGKSVQVIAELAGLSVPKDIRVLVAEETGVGRGHPYSNEKLAPILGFYTAPDYRKVCERCCEVLYYEGAGHTFIIHTENQEIVDYFAHRVPVSRFVVNSPGALGGIGASTGLMPALTLGCGAVGGSATSENVGPEQLYNLRYVAVGKKSLEEIRREAGEIELKPEAVNLDAKQIDEVVRRIINQLEAI